MLTTYAIAKKLPRKKKKKINGATSSPDRRAAAALTTAGRPPLKNSPFSFLLILPAVKEERRNGKGKGGKEILA